MKRTDSSAQHGPFRVTRRPVLLIVAALAVGALGACWENKASLTKSRIRKVEKGLLRAVYLKGQMPEKLPLEARMPFYKVPGVGIAVMDGNGLEWSKAYGVRDSRLFEPVTTETLFQAGAAGQPLAAATALKLVEQGRLRLESDVNAFLKSWKVPTAEGADKGPVTLRNLLAHAARFPVTPFSGHPRGGKIPTLMDILEGRADGYGPVAPEPGPGWPGRPSEAGYAVLQQLLEDVSGMPFPALAKETVTAPLGLARTTFEEPLPDAALAAASSGHGRDGRPVEGGALVYPATAADGLWTTPVELLLFAADVLASARGQGGRILSPETARVMLSPQAGNAGFGVFIDGAGTDVRIHLRGRTGGFTAVLEIYPYKGQGAVIMANSDNGFLLSDEILRALSAAYEWPDFKPEEKAVYRIDPSITRQYAGRYEVTPEYALDITAEDYYLVIRPTGQAPTRFYVESETFFFSVDPYIRIQFLSDEKGRVTGLVLWQEDFKQEAKKIG